MNKKTLREFVQGFLIWSEFLLLFTGRGQVRDIVFVVDSSNTANWAAILAFIKQIVAVFNVSPQGTHFAFVTFADTSNIAFQFPAANAEYNVQFVQRSIDGAKRSTGTRRNINLAMQNTLKLFTDKQLGARPNARKVRRIWTSKSLTKHLWFRMIFNVILFKK